MGNKQGKASSKRDKGREEARAENLRVPASGHRPNPSPASQPAGQQGSRGGDAKSTSKRLEANGGAPPPRVQQQPQQPRQLSAEGDSDEDTDLPQFTEQINVQNAPNAQKKVSIEDFQLLKVLGKGSFGKVMLVKKKDDGQIYAMKTLRKAALIKRNQLLHTKTERNILQNIRHPFLVNLQYAFQTPDKLYMVLDYMGGGELFFWLKKDRRFSQDRARLYAAEIMLALEELHSHDIIYRDLKPENILLGYDGHLKLTDFGLSKEAVSGAGPKGGTRTFCGTPEYLAPEILENKGHGKAVDWWSLGTLLFEMMTGLPPFYDQNMQRMYDKILHAPLRFPSYLSGDARDVLTKLLQRKIEDRLGSGKRGAGDIKDHPFFKALDFAKVYAKEYEPEFKPPQGNGVLDVRNFDREFTMERPEDSVVTTQLNETQKAKADFKGFTFDVSALPENK